MIERTEEYKGYTIQVLLDECANEFNPRVEYDNLGTMVCFHGRYSLGDKHDYDSRDYSGWDELLAAIQEREGPLVALPLYLYDHSGITMRVGSQEFRNVDSAGWDWGPVGYIYLTVERARKEWGWKRMSRKRTNRVIEVLTSEVKEYDKYLRGEVYGFQVTDSDGHHMDSCWGFLGDPEESGLLEQARESADYAAEKRDNSRVKAVLTMTFMYAKDEKVEAITKCLNRSANQLANKVLSFENVKAEEWSCDIAVSKEHL